MYVRGRILLGVLLVIASCAQADAEPHWIFFTPRPQREADRAISPLAAARLARLGMAPSRADLPVWEPWVAELRELGIRPRVRSRYLHAVSAMLDDAQVAAVRALPFVERIAPVRSLGRFPDRHSMEAHTPGPVPLGRAEQSYGLDIWQLAMLGIPDLHAEGLSGAGVRIAVLDSGFRKDHAAFSEITIGGERDFVYGDDNVQNDDAGDEHGTLTLSVLGGYDPDRLIGVAHGATYLLARTEEVGWERAVEEDYYVAGLEWADSMGAAIVSASLAYLDFPDEEQPWSYTPEQLDGRTAVTTRGVNQAADRGILVVVAAGNSGPGEASLFVPGDSEAALTVGAVEPWGKITDFSSRGPTADGRIKPDVVAQGTEVFCAGGFSMTGPPGYGYAQGTSLATPLIAGLAALILERDPSLGPEELKQVIRSSADRSAEPDGSYGCGIPWGPAAAAPNEASLVIDSLRFPVPPTAHQRVTFEARLRNVGGAVSEAVILGLFGSGGYSQIERTTESIGPLAPGADLWTGPWEIFTGQGVFDFGAMIGWEGVVFELTGADGNRRYRTAEFTLERTMGIGFTSISPSPWVDRSDLLVAYSGSYFDDPRVELYDVEGRLRGTFKPEFSAPSSYVRIAREKIPEVRSGKYFLYLRGEDYWDLAPILIIR